MKTRNSNKQIKAVQQSDGCCVINQIEEQPVQNSCCGSTQKRKKNYKQLVNAANQINNI